MKSCPIFFWFRGVISLIFDIRIRRAIGGAGDLAVF
jgi:hypothetical protein